MRAVLRTVARCHSAHVLHRDIKPGNFLLASDSPKAPLKAIGAHPFTARQWHAALCQMTVCRHPECHMWLDQWHQIDSDSRLIAKDLECFHRPCPDGLCSAADFGLAVFYDPATLPRTDLGLTGTPWCVMLRVAHSAQI